jgi:hypothetical protein
MPKITVITALTNNNDELREDFPGSDAEYVAFLDEESKESNSSLLWEVRDACTIFKESRRNAKIHKIMPHLYVDTDISIWLDANISLNITPEEMVKLWLNDGNDIAVCRHFERDCLYQEAEVCKTYKLDDPKVIDEQVARYKKNGYPERNGMPECGVIVRRHTPEINRLNERWWAEICRGSSRDQISFAYCFPKYKMFPVNARHSPLFNYNGHKKSGSQDYEKHYVQSITDTN